MLSLFPAKTRNFASTLTLSAVSLVFAFTNFSYAMDTPDDKRPNGYIIAKLPKELQDFTLRMVCPAHKDMEARLCQSFTPYFIDNDLRSVCTSWKKSIDEIVTQKVKNLCNGNTIHMHWKNVFYPSTSWSFIIPISTIDPMYESTRETTFAENSEKVKNCNRCVFVSKPKQSIHSTDICVYGLLRVFDSNNQQKIMNIRISLDSSSLSPQKSFSENLSEAAARLRNHPRPNGAPMFPLGLAPTQLTHPLLNAPVLEALELHRSRMVDKEDASDDSWSD